MLLAVDVGNTNIVFALFQGRAIKSRWRVATDPRRTADEYAVWLLQLMQLQGFDPKDVKQILISTVVPRALHNLTVLSQKYFKLDPLIAGQAPVEWGFEADIDDPRSLGADRAVNAIAAHARYPGDLIVVDFGTATTFDAIDFNGAYKGGIIAPGINLSLDALVNAAAKLPRIAIEAPTNSKSVIGRNTEDQMHIGVFWGYVAMMEGLIARMRAEIGRPAKVVATGGLAVLFGEHTDIFDYVDTDLTLDGLAILAERTGLAERVENS
ncbi:MAG: pantothenate kinase [Novosphingobium sp. 28-62-57]|uniref:type III pantothenate kinase n=1 Tax=unclassified Novosphingobium TaxID=2644732 RepID=UPI000BD7334F|nr:MULTISPECIES: type III pantothenate kinase [unclassified Novosphingobium]OYW48952.1 MAG: pantothenate kinase [Novosphingobium sp. 12-62-10]OYZ44051.1 MAG: pantothenate kinase [Novosphingobium sp. 16-62-11]OZA33469.1 MAG: pantothenate kinase [Novosphingobium sp. 17-62-9]OYZ09583.1 MAG: pantothenate kinase [Novosphingobium sp. 28-62-57]HQS68628.1 type III pantothenate kinase [Novosphingobium sp.]